MAGNETAFGALLTKRAREIGLEKSTFTNAEGFPDPNLRVTARARWRSSPATSCRDVPGFLSLCFAEREFTLEQYPPAEPQSAARHGHRRRRYEDRRNRGEPASIWSACAGLQDNFRLIVVVTGAKSDKERGDEAKKMLEMRPARF